MSSTQLLRQFLSARFLIFPPLLSAMADSASAAGVSLAGPSDLPTGPILPAIYSIASLLPCIALLPVAANIWTVFSMSPLGGPRPRSGDRNDQRRRTALLMGTGNQGEPPAEANREVSPPTQVVYIKHGNWATLSAAVRSEPGQ